MESSTAAQLGGATPSRREASRYTSGAGLPAPTSSDDTLALNSSRRPPRSRTRSMISRFDELARPSGQGSPIRRTASTAPSIHGTDRR